MLTKKGKYGIKAMTYLAQSVPGRLVSVTEIANARNIPRKFLDNIFIDLREAGLVLSRKGKGGGFYLAKTADQISIGEIIRALDGPLAPIACASRTGFARCADCDFDLCEVRALMSDVRNATAAILDNCSLQTAVNTPQMFIPL